jgi:gluconolactonase
LVDRYNGLRFNSPNDLCFDSAGNLYFSDPPYGLSPDATPELGYCGVFRLSPDWRTTLVHRDLERPNGLAFSPDEKILYVANSGEVDTFLIAMTLGPDGAATSVRRFFDASELLAAGRPGLMDGLRVDVAGNLWATGPGGVLILSPEGRHLGTILTGKATANCCFGGPDGSTLFIASHDRLLRVATRTKGADTVCRAAERMRQG